MKRSNLNLYDESGFLSENYIETTSGFCLQDASFKLGGGVDTDLIPKNIPNQLLLCSSASDTDSNFYKKYAEWSKQMFLGNPDYFVASLDCEVIMKATNNGVALTIPLLSRDKVDSALSTNPVKAQREYYNKFDSDGGNDSPIKRSAIMHNSISRKPLLGNEDEGKHKFALAFDPALDFDNSVVTVGEYVYDENKGWRLLIQNCVSFKELGVKKKKKNLPIDEQVLEIKEMFVKYNGKGFADFENIECFLIDIGAGGGGNRLPYDFVEDWVDKAGNTHRGIIDPEQYPELVEKYPHAMNKLIAVSPKKHKTEMYNSFVNFLNLDLIEFTDNYEMKDYINVAEINDKEIIEEINEDTKEVTKVNGIKYKKVKLSWEDKVALTNIDSAKEELIAMKSYKNNGVITKYELSPEKKNRMHDDRAYTFVMLAWYLNRLRDENIVNKKVKKSSIADYFLF